MSLLIKALEQAAKDRKAGRVEPEDTAAPAAAETPATAAPAAVRASAAAAPIEPTLEPLEPPPPRGGASARTERAPPPTPRTPPAGTGASPRASASPPPERAPAPRRASTSLAELQENDSQQQRARAAAVMQAGGGAASQAIAYLRANPVMMIGALAVLIGLAFGLYVYLQIAKPGLFVRQAATKPQQTPPPPPAAPAPSPPGLPETAAPGVPPANGIPADTAPAAPSPAVTAGAIIAPPAPVVASPGQIPAAAVVATAPPRDLPRAAAPERAPEARPTRGTVQPDPPRSAPAPAGATPPATEPASRERITVSPTSTQAQINPAVNQAYLLMQNGMLNEANALYTKVSRAEPLNVDAILGLAYIAAQENRSDDAMKLYLRILQLNPRHAVAQAALIGLMGRADPSASESRLKQLIAREPSAFLHFVLGNLYSDQSMWAQAQQSYFQAHHLEPENPDYAYNLAVGLDHLRQAKPALNFYRRADQLASAQGRSNFNLSHARERIRALSSQLE